MSDTPPKRVDPRSLSKELNVKSNRHAGGEGWSGQLALDGYPDHRFVITEGSCLQQSDFLGGEEFDMSTVCRISA